MMAACGKMNNRVSKLTSIQQMKCTCDSNFVNFCKLHCISHEKCNQLVCDLCNINSDIRNIQWHIASEKHRTKHRQLMDYILLINMPMATKAHTDKLSLILNNLAKENAMSERLYNKRLEIVDELNCMLKKNDNFKNMSVRLFGSSINGFALKSSDVNLELMTSDDTRREFLAKDLANVSDQIDKLRQHFIHIWNEFNLKIPKVHFTDKSSQLSCELTIYCERNYRSSQLLHYYSLVDERVKVLVIALRKWAKIYDFDDQENGTWPPHSFAILVIHYLQRCVPPVLPCFHEIWSLNSSNVANSESEGSPNKFEENDIEDFPDVKPIISSWKSQNNESVGELWLGMLRYYSVCFDLENDVVSIRNTGRPDTHKTKHWGSRVLAIEDPCRPSMNLSRSIPNMNIYNTFIQQFRYTYRYFATPTVRPNPKSFSNLPLFNEQNFDVTLDADYYKKPQADDIYMKMHQLKLDILNYEYNDDETDESDEETDEEDNDDNKRKEENIYQKAKKLLKKYGIRLRLQEAVVLQICKVPRDDFFFSFEFKKLPFFQRPAKFCRVCHKTGHLQSHCPDEKLIPLIPLEPMKEDYKKRLDEICGILYEQQRLDEVKKNLLHEILDDLQHFLRTEYRIEACLEFYGSIKNGFGAKNCDLDIRLTFDKNQSGNDLDFSDIVKQVGKALERHKNIKNVLPIVSAKVPIVKFSYMHSSQTFECDISLYNFLAGYNTQLLSTYCQIDERVVMLGFAVKHFAKKCDICDASRGSLSSYAYVLMTLHFLQQRGVIPVLQEVGLEEKQERIIDGWETWFYSDLTNLHKYWTSTNHESVGELFLGFFRYYSEQFKFEEYVVCCRQSALLKRIDKMWTGRKLAIEDPFLLSHNLGAGVDDQMANFIKTAIIKARNHIGSYHDKDPKVLIDFLFDKRNITHGLLPTGHGCRYCGKIGHKISKCPIKLEHKTKRQIRQTNRDNKQPNRQRHQRQNKHQKKANQQADVVHQTNIVQQNHVVKQNNAVKQTNVQQANFVQQSNFVPHSIGLPPGIALSQNIAAQQGFGAQRGYTMQHGFGVQQPGFPIQQQSFPLHQTPPKNRQFTNQFN